MSESIINNRNTQMENDVEPVIRKISNFPTRTNTHRGEGKQTTTTITTKNCNAALIKCVQLFRANR